MSLLLSWLAGRGRGRLRAARTVLEPPAERHYAEWARLREASRGHLVPYEPRWSDDELSRRAWRRRLVRYRRDRRQGTGEAYLVVRSADGALVGGVTLSNVRRGVTQSASVGYWIGLPYVRQGYASEALATVLAHGFETMGLHRVEAACMPRNLASVGVLEKAGFRREGLARRYLRIDGRWEDHILLAILADEFAVARARSGSRAADAEAPQAASAAGRHAEPVPQGHDVSRPWAARWSA
jgi:ribosomal-protein-alanine N-acetyltransferase